VLALAVVAFAIGAIVGAHAGGSPADDLAARFVKAWTRHEYAAMYEDLDPASRRSISASELAAACGEALTTATASAARVTGRARGAGGRIVVPVRVTTRLFGTLNLEYALPVRESEGAMHVVWSRSLTFPGLDPGDQLSRRTTLPQRAPLLARDGSVLAEGPSGDAVASETGETTRTSPLGEVAKAVIGTVGPPPASRRRQLESEGVPSDGLVGISGLERALDTRLRGKPGGVLLAGERVIGAARSQPATPVETTISPQIQKASVAALGGQLGGIVVMQPTTGQLLAVAGLGLDGLQPPGSTFKMVTLTGALSSHVATIHTTFPYATYATLDGVQLHNANGEECGGTLEHAFAVSCNSVFTPLGVKLGADRLVAAAERFGFNHEPGIAGAAESTLPPASQIQGELAVGSTAIGQGEVLATPLQMLTVAATVADGGRRPRPTFEAGAAADYVARGMSSSVARTVRHLMTDVVREGTGVSAAIPGVTVAGKTGTAELKTECTQQQKEAQAEAGTTTTESGSPSCQQSEASNTDAWFAAFAPAIHPRVAVCVLLVKDGAGGTTAAPVAREVIEAALQAGI
jgi:cell division protein FtsI/penicillin-binding protein 2